MTPTMMGLVFLAVVGCSVLSSWWTAYLLRGQQKPATDAAAFAGSVNQSLVKAVEEANARFLDLATALVNSRKHETNGRSMPMRVPVHIEDDTPDSATDVVR